MANSYFKFKQFKIHQDKCAMKVTTDACLFGALVAEVKLKKTTCLDIGTGTGLLSLMLAQKNKTSKIDALEIDTAAATQARENILASPWADRITVFNEDALKFPVGPQAAAGKQYDCIISNPPFFEDDLQSPDKAKNKAKHNSSLTLAQLLRIVDRQLAAEGFFAVLLPYHRVGYFVEEALKQGLFLTRQILVKQTLKHKFFRGILCFKRIEKKLNSKELIIKDLEHNYTPEFSEALKDYYLFL